MKTRYASSPLETLKRDLMSRCFQRESLLFLYTLKVCTAADNPPKEVIIHNNMTLRLIDIWEEPKWEMAFVISRTAVNPLFK